MARSRTPHNPPCPDGVVFALVALATLAGAGLHLLLTGFCFPR